MMKLVTKQLLKIGLNRSSFRLIVIGINVVNMFYFLYRTYLETISKPQRSNSELLIMLILVIDLFFSTRYGVYLITKMITFIYHRQYYFCAFPCHFTKSFSLFIDMFPLTITAFDADNGKRCLRIHVKLH